MAQRGKSKLFRTSSKHGASRANSGRNQNLVAPRKTKRELVAINDETKRRVAIARKKRLAHFAHKASRAGTNSSSPLPATAAGSRQAGAKYHGNRRHTPFDEMPYSQKRGVLLDVIAAAKDANMTSGLTQRRGGERGGGRRAVVHRTATRVDSSPYARSNRVRLSRCEMPKYIDSSSPALPSSNLPSSPPPHAGTASAPVQPLSLPSSRAMTSTLAASAPSSSPVRPLSSPVGKRAALEKRGIKQSKAGKAGRKVD